MKKLSSVNENECLIFTNESSNGIEVTLKSTYEAKNMGKNLKKKIKK